MKKKQTTFFYFKQLKICRNSKVLCFMIIIIFVKLFIPMCLKNYKLYEDSNLKIYTFFLIIFRMIFSGYMPKSQIRTTGCGGSGVWMGLNGSHCGPRQYAAIWACCSLWSTEYWRPDHLHQWNLISWTATFCLPNLYKGGKTYIYPYSLEHSYIDWDLGEWADCICICLFKIVYVCI